jgi:hypothetical protein
MILRACHRYWPECRFQDVHEDALHTLDEPWVWEAGTVSPEFFVHRDAGAANAWDELGAVPSNSNTMLHFLIRSCALGASPVTEITCVCDGREGAVAKIIDQIESGLLFTMLDARIAA